MGSAVVKPLTRRRGKIKKEEAPVDTSHHFQENQTGNCEHDLKSEVNSVTDSTPNLRQSQLLSGNTHKVSGDNVRHSRKVCCTYAFLNRKSNAYDSDEECKPAQLVQGERVGKVPSSNSNGKPRGSLHATDGSIPPHIVPTSSKDNMRAPSRASQDGHSSNAAKICSRNVVEITTSSSQLQNMCKPENVRSESAELANQLIESDSKVEAFDNDLEDCTCAQDKDSICDTSIVALPEEFSVAPKNNSIRLETHTTSPSFKSLENFAEAKIGNLAEEVTCIDAVDKLLVKHMEPVPLTVANMLYATSNQECVDGQYHGTGEPLSTNANVARRLLDLDLKHNYAVNFCQGLNYGQVCDKSRQNLAFATRKTNNRYDDHTLDNSLGFELKSRADLTLECNENNAFNSSDMYLSAMKKSLLQPGSNHSSKTSLIGNIKLSRSESLSLNHPHVEEVLAVGEEFVEEIDENLLPQNTIQSPHSAVWKGSTKDLCGRNLESPAASIKLTASAHDKIGQCESCRQGARSTQMDKSECSRPDSRGQKAREASSRQGMVRREFSPSGSGTCVTCGEICGQVGGPDCDQCDKCGRIFPGTTASASSSSLACSSPVSDGHEPELLDYFNASHFPTCRLDAATLAVNGGSTPTHSSDHCDPACHCSGYSQLEDKGSSPATRGSPQFPLSQTRDLIADTNAEHSQEDSMKNGSRRHSQSPDVGNAPRPTTKAVPVSLHPELCLGSAALESWNVPAEERKDLAGVLDVSLGRTPSMIPNSLQDLNCDEEMVPTELSPARSPISTFLNCRPHSATNSRHSSSRSSTPCKANCSPCQKIIGPTEEVSATLSFSQVIGSHVNSSQSTGQPRPPSRSSSRVGQKQSTEHFQQTDPSLSSLRLSDRRCAETNPPVQSQSSVRTSTSKVGCSLGIDSSLPHPSLSRSSVVSKVDSASAKNSFQPIRSLSKSSSISRLNCPRVVTSKSSCTSKGDCCVGAEINSSERRSSVSSSADKVDNMCTFVQESKSNQSVKSLPRSPLHETQSHRFAPSKTTSRSSVSSKVSMMADHRAESNPRVNTPSRFSMISAKSDPPDHIPRNHSRPSVSYSRHTTVCQTSSTHDSQIYCSPLLKSASKTSIKSQASNLTDAREEVNRVIKSSSSNTGYPQTVGAVGEHPVLINSVTSLYSISTPPKLAGEATGPVTINEPQKSTSKLSVSSRVAVGQKASIDSSSLSDSASVYSREASLRDVSKMSKSRTSVKSNNVCDALEKAVTSLTPTRSLSKSSTASKSCREIGHCTGSTSSNMLSLTVTQTKIFQTEQSSLETQSLPERNTLTLNREDLPTKTRPSSQRAMIHPEVTTVATPPLQICSKCSISSRCSAGRQHVDSAQHVRSCTSQDQSGIALPSRSSTRSKTDHGRELMLADTPQPQQPPPASSNSKQWASTLDPPSHSTKYLSSDDNNVSLSSDNHETHVEVFSVQADQSRISMTHDPDALETTTGAARAHLSLSSSSLSSKSTAELSQDLEGHQSVASGCLDEISHGLLNSQEECLAKGTLMMPAVLASPPYCLSPDQIGNIRRQLYEEGLKPAEREGGVAFFIPVTEDGLLPQFAGTQVAERLTKTKKASLNYEERMFLANINRQVQLSKKKEFAIRDIRNVKGATNSSDGSDRTKQNDDLDELGSSP